ncbi:phosphoribosylglycinamide formyltransferase [Thomasclavelia sp.]|uniref:phosphoribosylglycinamide formyltransferase n=1 Tax=Thomasclavelia sp. TaxID=3025757 RepID=UPI0025E9B746|nr:phosphoribosylglycinamide formyltransferase [Thomasclavelia sp.]
MLKKIAVFVSGGGTDLQSVIDAVNHGSINGEIVLVVSNRKNAYGLTRAKNAGIETAVVKKDDQLLVKMLQERNVDLIVLAGYLAILTDVLIDAYPNKIINIHPSLIPSFCGPGFYGMHVHESVLNKGVKVTGATVHFVTGEVDGGPIILQEACNIDDLDNAEDIQKRVLEIEHQLLPKAVALFCDDRIVVENERAKVI